MTRNFISHDVLPLFSSEDSINILLTIVGCMYSGIVMAKTEGNFLAWNAVATEILGPKENVQPENWSKFYGCFDPDTEKQMNYEELPLFQALQGNSVKDKVILIKNKYTPRGWIKCKADPVYHQDELIGGIVVFDDISKEMLLQEDINKFLNKVEPIQKKILNVI